MNIRFGGGEKGSGMGGGLLFVRYHPAKSWKQFVRVGKE